MIYLYTYEVELAQPRDSELDVNKIRDELGKRFGWILGLGWKNVIIGTAVLIGIMVLGTLSVLIYHEWY